MWYSLTHFHLLARGFCQVSSRISDKVTSWLVNTEDSNSSADAAVSNVLLAETGGRAIVDFSKEADIRAISVASSLSLQLATLSCHNSVSTCPGKFDSDANSKLDPLLPSGPCVWALSLTLKRSVQDCLDVGFPFNASRTIFSIVEYVRFMVSLVRIFKR